MIRAASIAGLLISAAFLTGCGETSARRTVSFTVPWENYENVVIRSRNGRVSLLPSNDSTVRVDATVRVRGRFGDDAERSVRLMEVVAVKDQKNPSTLLIELRAPAPLDRNAPGSDIAVALPVPAPADIRTSNGPIVVERMAGRQKLETTNGAVTVRDTKGDVEIRNTNGTVDVLNVEGNLMIGAANAPVSVRDLLGDLRVRNMNAGIDVESREGNVDVATTYGPIRAIAAPPLENGSVVARTTDGTVRLVLPRDLAGEIDLRTVNAPVRANFPAGLPVEYVLQRRESLRAVMGGGGSNRVIAETSNAGVQVDFR